VGARGALIESTKTLLSTRGYESTSPRDIQRASGVGQGSFYHHFESKAALASAALESLAEEMIADFDRLPGGGGELVRCYLEQSRDALAGCRIGRIAMESAMAEEDIRRPVGEYFGHLRDRLETAFEELDIGVPAASLADLAIAAVQGGYVIARSTNDARAVEHATSALIGLVETAMATREESS